MDTPIREKTIMHFEKNEWGFVADRIPMGIPIDTQRIIAQRTIQKVLTKRTLNWSITGARVT
jgi:hypothetical protein